ncbi:putative uncharacterized protein DDB_G0282499 [Microplitis demolitor]|uniref:putative uncharacterized protein DDB_G0282499 n=1 Tax=Microplitis demolitor TaxID=69319 RepID=UPI000440008F|nr:putative uncharacterized protein DDB_G0282499 [Microplitis demolitor]XP_008560906.1 putative uncharacterized protein DDB_G0282499 [Microplitis demolitor]XP_008560907.1 putative uncharacterized protein DDB_G0282499 [Microplitis demolitor]
MYLTCKCLNIIIKYSPSQLAKDPELSPFPNHEFFRDNLQIVELTEDNSAVLKRQPALIDEELIDTWRITRCINCYQYTHAITDNPDNLDIKKTDDKQSIRYLLINKSLITIDNSDDNPELSLKNSNISNSMSTNVKSQFIPDTSQLPSDNSSLINDNSRLINDNSFISDKTMIFSDNIPLMSDNSTLMSDNSTLINDNSLSNSSLSIDNSLTTRSTTNLNDNSLIMSDNSFNVNDNSNITSDNLTLVSDNTLITSDNSKTLRDNSKISLITSDNSTISHDNSLIIDDNSFIKNNNILNKFKNNKNFSDIYRVIIDNNNDNDDNDISIIKKKLLPSVQLSLGNLQQQYEIKVKNMKDIVDDNIKKFIAKQYEYLDNFKERGHRDYCILSNKILRNEFKKIKSDINCGVISDNDNDNELSGASKTEGYSSAKRSDIVRPITEDNLFVPGSLMFSERSDKMADDEVEGKREMKREKNKSGGKRIKRRQTKKQSNDIDDEVIFAIEGMDDNDMEVEDNKVSDDDDEDDELEVDTDDSGQDEGIHIPRVQRGGHPTLAKSLPVSVPNFLFGQRPHRRNDDQESMDPLDPHNIRASIKALAKSVHGDTVFGDLPRPRFSTEI